MKKERGLLRNRGIIGTFTKTSADESGLLKLRAVSTSICATGELQPGLPLSMLLAKRRDSRSPRQAAAF